METPKRGRPFKNRTTPTTTNEPSTSKRQREEDESPQQIVRRRRNVSVDKQDDELINIELNFVNIIKKLFNNDENDTIIRYLKLIGILAKNLECECGTAMAFKRNVAKIDKWEWICTGVACKKHKSIRTNSFFSGQKLTLEQHMILIYHWFFKCSQKLAGYNACLMDFSSRSGNHTVIDHYNFCRDVCRESMLDNGEAIGGEGRIVEIDESAFGKRKYNRGSRRNTYWVFGGIERDSNNGFLVAVRKRSKRRLWPHIVKYIRPGTTIISDGWKAYHGLDKINNYKHLTVNHKENFVDPETNAHTNTCEGSWLHTKASFPKFGTRKKMLANYFAEFIWRRKYSNNKSNGMKIFLEHVAKVYNPDIPRPYIQQESTESREYQFDDDLNAEEDDIPDYIITDDNRQVFFGEEDDDDECDDEDDVYLLEEDYELD